MTNLAKSFKFSGLLLALGGSSSAQHALAAESNCSSIANRIAFVFEHEGCALESKLTDEAIDAYFKATIWPNAYKATWKNVPNPPRAELEKRLGFAPEPDQQVVVVAKTKQPWMTKFLKADQAAGGGGIIGSAIRLCLVKGEDGHYEITLKQASDLGWPLDAAKYLAKASRDADTYEWNSPAAHAQTPNAPADGVKPGKVDDGIKAFGAKLADYRKKIATACKDNKPERALYVLGYMLHAVQDLSTHAGQTNAEHSWRSLLGHNPDASSQSVTRAHTFTKKVLGTAVSASCEASMKKVTGAGVDMDAMAVSLFDQKDGTATALMAFEALGARYWLEKKLGNVTPDTFWFDVTSDFKADEFFTKYVTPKIKP
jgi:hypothetical protein